MALIHSAPGSACWAEPCGADVKGQSRQYCIASFNVLNRQLIKLGINHGIGTVAAAGLAATSAGARFNVKATGDGSASTGVLKEGCRGSRGCPKAVGMDTRRRSTAKKTLGAGQRRRQ